MKARRLYPVLLSACSLLLAHFTAHAQTAVIPKGTTVYIVQHSESELKDSVPDLRGTLQEMLEDWGYFLIVSDSTAADLTLAVQIKYVKESALNSFSIFNRRAALVDATLRNPSGEDLWQCEQFKIGEKGMIGYNFGKAAMKTLVKEMKKGMK